MKRTIPVFAACLLAACGREPARPAAAEASARPVVYTTFYPATYFTRRLAGDLVEVVCPVPPEEDPIFWMPDASAIAAYQKADLIVLNGAQYEKWVARVSLPLARIVDSAAPFRAEWLTFKDATVHSHGKSGTHSHTGIDGHTWLDPVNARNQAQEIEKSLARVLPEHTDELERGFRALAADLDALDAGYRKLGALPEGESLFASHPAYNYLARRYGWSVVNFGLDPATVPTDVQLARIGERLDATPARYLLWEAEPAPGVAKRVEAVLALKSIVFSPCEAAPETGDYLAVMRANLARLAEAFTTGPR